MSMRVCFRVNNVNFAPRAQQQKSEYPAVIFKWCFCFWANLSLNKFYCAEAFECVGLRVC